jgi:hypothetical protein
MKLERVKELMKKYREMLPEVSFSEVVTLSGLDDGAHMGECTQMCRDLKTYPMFEAVVLAFSYLPEENASSFADAVLRCSGIDSGDLYCRLCGTTEEDKFDLEINTKLCMSCHGDGLLEATCSFCRKSTYEFDIYGVHLFTPKGVKTLKESDIVVEEGDVYTKELQRRLEIDPQLMEKMGLAVISFEFKDGARIACQRCIDRNNC